MTEVIASRDNERVKRACKLRDSGARRAAEGRFLAEGLRLCTDLAQRLPPEEVYCTQKLLDAHPELAALGGRHFLVSDAVAAKLSDTKAPQGLFCVFPRRTKTLEAVRGVWASAQEVGQEEDFSHTLFEICEQTAQEQTMRMK